MDTQEQRFMVAPRANFDSLWCAITTIFIIIVGEDWPGIMYNYVRMGDLDPNNPIGYWYTPFFLFVFSLGNLMLLSLFTAILLQNFESTEDEKRLQDEQFE